MGDSDTAKWKRSASSLSMLDRPGSDGPSVPPLAALSCHRVRAARPQADTLYGTKPLVGQACGLRESSRALVLHGLAVGLTGCSHRPSAKARRRCWSQTQPGSRMHADRGSGNGYPARRRGCRSVWALLMWATLLTVGPHSLLIAAGATPRPGVRAGDGRRGAGARTPDAPGPTGPPVRTRVSESSDDVGAARTTAARMTAEERGLTLAYVGILFTILGTMVSIALPGIQSAWHGRLLEWLLTATARDHRNHERALDLLLDSEGARR